MDCRHLIGSPAIGSPCAFKRLARPSRRCCGGLLFCNHFSQESYMTVENIPNGLPPQDNAWHALKAEEVLENLKVRDQGLTTEEAERRRAIAGLNELKEAPRPGLLSMLWDQINSFVVWLLIIASIISALLGD
ncbi:hypothetical protein EG834_16445, partial [bacterium]|nr:hypothetical protein [bacterium]